MAEKAKLEQNQKEKPLSFMAMVILTGLIGGIFWSALGYLAYLFNFTDIHPNVILEPWALGAWKKQWLGTVISIILMGVLSIGVALVYYAVLKKMKSIFIGIGFGIGIFLLVFLILNPIFPGIKPFLDLSLNTIITSVCLYALYGAFIGYSISYEYQEQEYRENQEVREKEVSS
ncbi:hypothetical protein EKG37_04965 [Robertmurraya yapensis]|uniref:Uncharacterized protein n=2 Tax=Bacillaceae TaxID=186817 RepID=A0A3S0J0A4_9BACI|nr:YqhR family membrane protein [Bacillus yapensis]RTR35234.1 hypothetical protein EKG37_04965 [Bacillus yapensis]TKS97743.1 hypothetical protein FAR12_04965 [Bacillus yapensis]